MLIASAGVVEVNCHDGAGWATYALDRPSLALHVPPGTWAVETYLTEVSLLTVLASHPYDPGDYVNDYDEFLREAEANRVERAR